MFFANNLHNIDHCFFSRLGGTSSGVHKSLNCGKGSNDQNNLVNLNRKIITDYYNLPKKNLITLNQTHSNKVVIINNFQNQKKYNYDGIVTKNKNIVLGILTADCAPVLFYDSSNNVIGACHAGWKGSLDGIIKNTINAMLSLGSMKNKIKCAIGPCIESDSYTVGSDFYKKFIQKDIKNRLFFIAGKNKKYKFCLKNYIINELIKLNIGSIYSINIDTYNSEHLFYSYRRSLHKKENDYGRMISTIVIKE